METKEILHVLRNPYSHSEVYQREVRLAACDLIETLKRKELALLEVIYRKDPIIKESFKNKFLNFLQF